MEIRSKSLLLSICLVVFAFLLEIGFAIFFAFDQRQPIIALFFYLQWIPGVVALYSFWKLLRNFQKQIVFSEENVFWLRRISWACFFITIFLLVGACLKVILCLAAGAIGFLGLFSRVIKNMLTEAIQLKEENEYTI